MSPIPGQETILLRHPMRPAADESAEACRRGFRCKAQGRPFRSVHLRNSRCGARADVGARGFLFLIVPSMVVSSFAVWQGRLPFPLVAGSTIARDLSLVALVLFLVRNAGEPVTSIGWTRRRLGRELMVGVALFPAIFLGSLFVERTMRTAGFTGPSTPQPDLIPAPDLAQLLLAVTLVAVVAIAEETIFRGYLMMRLGQATGSVATAVVLSAFIFSLGHGYEGTAVSLPLDSRAPFSARVPVGEEHRCSYGDPFPPGPRRDRHRAPRTPMTDRRNVTERPAVGSATSADECRCPSAWEHARHEHMRIHGDEAPSQHATVRLRRSWGLTVRRISASNVGRLAGGSTWARSVVHA